jgi:hypothetical protein
LLVIGRAAQAAVGTGHPSTAPLNRNRSPFKPFNRCAPSQSFKLFEQIRTQTGFKVFGILEYGSWQSRCSWQFSFRRETQAELI